MKPGRFRSLRAFDFTLDDLGLDTELRREITDRAKELSRKSQIYGHGVGFEDGANEAMHTISALALGAKVR